MERSWLLGASVYDGTRAVRCFGSGQRVERSCAVANEDWSKGGVSGDRRVGVASKSRGTRHSWSGDATRVAAGP